MPTTDPALLEKIKERLLDEIQEALLKGDQAQVDRVLVSLRAIEAANRPDSHRSTS